MAREEVGGRRIAAHFHGAQLDELPAVEVCGSVATFEQRLGQRHGRSPNEGYVHAQVAVDAGAVEADVDTIGYTRPRRVARLAVKADLGRRKTTLGIQTSLEDMPCWAFAT